MGFDVRAAEIDAAIDAPLGPWSNQTAVIGGVGDDDPTLPDDMLELYFNRGGDIYLARRAALGDPWGTPALVAELNSVDTDTAPKISRDGLAIYFASTRPGGFGSTRSIWMATRATRLDAWGNPTFVPDVSSSLQDTPGYLTSDQLSFVFSSERTTGTSQVHESVRADVGLAWSVPVRVDLGGSGLDADPCTSPDGLTLFFASSRSGAIDLYVARRTDRSAPFGTPAPITELNTPDEERDPWISADGRHLFFARGPFGSEIMYEVTR